LLPALTPIATAPPLGEVARSFQRVWIDHVFDWGSRALHPTENMPGYGATLNSVLSIGALRLMLNDPLSQKEALLVNFVQVGIDMFGLYKVGHYWPPNGGHMAGRKWPILFAGIMLNDAEMKNIGSDNFNSPYYGGTSEPFQEDCQTFYSGGKAIYGIRHCQGNNNSTKYQFCCNPHSWAGWVLAARMMHAEELWNHDALFEYEDGWMTACLANRDNCGYYGSKFADQMWGAYRNNLPAEQDLTGIGNPSFNSSHSKTNHDNPVLLLQNPVSGTIEFITNDGVDINDITFFTSSGEVTLNNMLARPGLYFYLYKQGEKVITGKIVKIK